MTADNIQTLSGLSPDAAVALLESTYPGTDWIFFDVPGGSVVGDRVLSFLPRGPLSVTRAVQRYDEDLRALHLGVHARRRAPDRGARTVPASP